MIVGLYSSNRYFKWVCHWLIGFRAGCDHVGSNILRAYQGRFQCFIAMIEFSLLFEHWKRKLGCALDNIITVPPSFQSWIGLLQLSQTKTRIFDDMDLVKLTKDGFKSVLLARHLSLDDEFSKVEADIKSSTSNWCLPWREIVPTR